MITAEEARNLMPKYDILNDEYPELNNLIESAAECGENSIEYIIIGSIEHVKTFRMALLKLGYTTDVKDEKYSSSGNHVRCVLKIKW